MKSIIITLSIFCLSCLDLENNSKSQYTKLTENKDAIDLESMHYEYKHIMVEVTSLTPSSMNFLATIGGKRIVGNGTLVRLEDERGMYVPEGTDILDENTMEQYSCDSTYSYKSDSVTLTFAIENITKKRMSLIISNSTINGVENEFYTLYLKE